MTGKVDFAPILGKLFCSTSEAVLVVRKRPHMVGGGGFVVTDSDQKVVFKVDGCGIVGTKGELVLRDADGEPLLLIRRKVFTFPLHLFHLSILALGLYFCSDNFRDI